MKGRFRRVENYSIQSNAIVNFFYLSPKYKYKLPSFCAKIVKNNDEFQSNNYSNDIMNIIFIFILYLIVPSFPSTVHLSFSPIFLTYSNTSLNFAIFNNSEFLPFWLKNNHYNRYFLSYIQLLPFLLVIIKLHCCCIAR